MSQTDSNLGGDDNNFSSQWPELDPIDSEVCGLYVSAFYYILKMLSNCTSGLLKNCNLLTYIHAFKHHISSNGISMIDDPWYFAFHIKFYYCYHHYY